MLLSLAVSAGDAEVHGFDALKHSDLLSPSTADISLAPSASTGAVEPDWSVFHISDETLDIKESIGVVQSIPVQYFWDFHKGQFKFGILGESVEEFYPHFVTNSRMKFSIDSPIYNVTSANTDVIFSHLVLVIQYLAMKISGDLGSSVSELLAESDNIALKIIRIANETGIEWRTANEIRTSREVIEIKKEIVQSELIRTLTRNQYRNDSFHFYWDEKVKLLETQHEHILEAIMASHARQDRIEQQKQEDLMRLSEATENKRRDTQAAILQHAHDAAIDRLAVEVELGVKAIRFRATEEGRVDRENEDLAVNLMKAKGESLRKGFEEIVTMLHLKATMLVQDAFDNPAFVFRYVLIVAAGLSLYIILLETAQAFRSYMASKVNTPAVLKEAWNRKEQDMSATLILSDENTARLESVSHVYEMVRKSQATKTTLPLVLPNVLIVGPPGTGKTMSAQMLAQRSGFPYIVVCGGDLLAVAGDDTSSLSADSSSAPGRYLRDVLHGARAVSGGFLVILDEVEGIIVDRGRRKDKLDKQLMSEEGADASTVSLESKECIHILLNMLRLNSAALGVIINTSMKLQFVDPALLDRVDRVVTLELPDASLRLSLAVRYTHKLLAAYFKEATTRVQLETLSNENNISLTSCTEKAFVATMKKVLGDDATVDMSLSPSDTKKPKAKEALPSPAVKRKGRPRKSAAEQQVKDNEGNDNGDVSSKSAAAEENSPSKTGAPSFNLFYCLFYLVECSEGWSHRELCKVIQNIHSEVIATEECMLRTEDWVHQVNFKIQSKQMGSD